MEKVIIFSASTGGGHNQVAFVLEKEFKLYNYDVKVIDFLKETSLLLDLFIATGYNKLASRSANIYGLIYKTSNREQFNKQLKAIFTKILKNKLKLIIKEFKPNIIITTHPIIVNILGVLKARGEINIPIISIITDFEAHNFYVNRNIDAYIIPCDHTKETLIKKCIPEEKIFLYGIPVKKEFWIKQATDKQKAKFTILLMGGSIGLNYVNKVVKTLLSNPNPLNILVVCGNNHHLEKRIQEKYKTIPLNKSITIYGFTCQIPELMDRADVVITKPGGVTISEAIAKNIPLIIPYAIPGQEEENSRILVENGLAVRTTSLLELNQLISAFITKPEVLKSLADNMSALSQDHSVESTIHLAEQLILKYKSELHKLRKLPM